MTLLRRAADVAHNAATQARIEFRFEVNAAPVVADEGRVLQVLNELVGNAIKFSPPARPSCWRRGMWMELHRVPALQTWARRVS